MCTNRALYQLLLSRELDRQQRSGHWTDTYGSDVCPHCKLIVDVAAAAAGVGAASFVSAHSG